MFRKNSPSLRKILKIMLFILIPTIVICSLFVIYTAWNTQDSNTQKTLSAVEIQNKENADLLNRMNYFLLDTLFNNANIKAIHSSDDVLSKNGAARAFWNELNFESIFWASDFSFLFHNEQEDRTIFKFNNSIPDLDNIHIQDAVLYEIQNEKLSQNNLEWRYVVLNDHAYLHQTYSNNGSYLSSWISCDALFQNIKMLLSDKGRLTLLNNNDAPIIKNDGDRMQNDDNTPVSPNPSWGQISEIYYLQKSNIRFHIGDSPLFDKENLFLLLLFILCVLFIIIAVSLYSIRYYKKYIESPLTRFLAHINDYSSIKNEKERYGFSELNDALNAFDSVTSQLNKLKIDSYEEKLAFARTELEYYQLQIKPHFFANCFSIIFAMAQTNENAQIQEFCIKLSNYVRYLLSDSLELIELTRELEIMNEYLIYRTSGTIHILFYWKE